MRLLHVSDWHLGATLGRIARDVDLGAVIDEMVGIAAELRPHLILHTGDLFDSARPPVESMRLGIGGLRRLAEHAPVVVIAGNHDSRPLFRLFNEILAASGSSSPIRFVADLVPPEAGGVLEFPGEGDELIRLIAMPFLHPNSLVDVFETPPEGWTGKYADGVRTLQAMLARGLEEGFDPRRHINLYAAHLHVGGAVLARSERVVHVSEDYALDAESLPPVSYAAFGHIHKPQPLPGLVPGRYAGSPIQLDYGELDEQKVVVFVEAHPGQAAKIETRPLSGGRPLARLEGTLEELRAWAPRHQDRVILAATLVSDEVVADPAPLVAELFPNADLYSVACRLQGQTFVPAEAAEGPEPELDVRMHFRNYVETSGGLGPGESNRIASLFERLLDAVETEQEPIIEEAASLLQQGG